MEAMFTRVSSLFSGDDAGAPPCALACLASLVTLGNEYQPRDFLKRATFQNLHGALIWSSRQSGDGFKGQTGL